MPGLAAGARPADMEAMTSSHRAPFADATAPSLDLFAEIAAQAWQSLPHAFRSLSGDVEIRVLDFAEDEVLEELGMDNPFELTGLYSGVDLRNRSVIDPMPMASQVFLYRRPILDEWAERGDVTLADLIAHVLIHEIGHHFGLSDDDIEAIEADAR